MRHFLLCFSLLLFAIDLKARPIPPDATEEADSILALVTAEISNVKPAKALELATEALSLSRDAGYSKGKAMSCFYIGQVLSYFGDYEKSIEYLQLSAEEKYSRKNAIIQSEISRIKGQVYYMLNLDKASFHEFQKAHDYAIQIKDKSERSHHTSLAYENLGMAYNLIKGIPDSSLYWLKKNEELLATTDENRTFRSKINLYSHYGEHYTAQQQYDTASFYFEEAYSLILKYNYPYSSWLFQRWGDLQKQRGNSDSAMIFYRKGLDNLKATHIKNELPGFYKRISDIYSEQGIEDSAKVYREKELQLNAELGSERSKAAEDAVGMLLEEERKLSAGQIRRFISLWIFIFITIMLLFGVLYRQSITGKKKILYKKETEVSELKEKLNSAFEEIVELAKNNDSALLPRFRKVYPEFTRSLLSRHPDLTNAELRLTVMIFLNFPSKEIAEYMFITHRSVQTNKSRLRKKLNIPGETDLYRYFKEFS